MAKKKTTRRPASRETWQTWLARHDFQTLGEIPDDVLDQPWAPTDEDRAAAWELYTEMRTRISTQPLHSLSGDEESALSSIASLFQTTREVLRKHGPKVRHFATITTFVLNVDIRPFTARWHPRLKAGAFESGDGCHEFRQELATLQEKLTKFQTFLGRLAEDAEFQLGSESGHDVIRKKHFSLGPPIPFDSFSEYAGPTDRIPPEMLAAEQREIALRRDPTAEEVDGVVPEDLVGLAISGGGIRSATFALGVLQGLTTTLRSSKANEDRATDLLRDVDVLSTVSGGGYLGCFLSSYLNDAESHARSSEQIGTGCKQLPFRKEGKCESMPLRYLRNHSRYLTSGGFFGKLKMIAQGLYGVLMNMIVLITLIALAVLVTGHLPIGSRIVEAAHDLASHAGPTFVLSKFTRSILQIWVGLVLFLPLVQKVGRTSDDRSSFRAFYETVCVWGFGFALLALLYDLLPTAHYTFLWASSEIGLYQPDLKKFDWDEAAWGGLVNLAAFFGARGALLKAAQSSSSKKKWLGLLQKSVPILLTLAGPLFLAILYFLLCQRFLVNDPHLPLVEFGIELAIGPLLLIAAVYGFLVLNVNFISPHRYYRNRLVETYLLRPVKRDPSGGKVESVDGQKLSDLGRTRKAPYHLLNGALNLPASRNPELRGRDSDFFLFSKHFCGSPIIGYSPTLNWQEYDGHFDLGTAMAISGAAASPHMGATTPTGASFFLTLLNVRLGCWLRRPIGEFSTPWFVRTLGGPGPWYLLREMFGRVHERTRHVNVSDGGHIENLGIYELLRRRCRYIIAIDGEHDPQLKCRGLMHLSQLAWIDFGIRIDIDLTPLQLNEAGLSRSHYAVGRIEYPDGKLGILLYIKLSATGNEPQYVMDYRRREAEFPHQPTSDQIFDEDQFEAYRRLGEHASEDLFRGEPLKSNRIKHPLQKWFQNLADNAFES